jgi:monothiol glutaredoxin
MSVSSSEKQETLNQRIQAQLKAHPIMLYMKGTRDMPQCGFSARAVDVLNHLGVTYETHDVLSDSELRFGMKHFSQWPTFPQLFVAGQLVGGSDIMVQMYESGELKKLLQERNLLK